MNKLPIKQIYLLNIIIIGIIALSVYSTYAIFTFEKSTQNIVSIHTPNSLTISESISEYSQIVVPKDSYIKTDIDIYNSKEYELCYGVWYQIIESESNKDLVKVYKINTGSDSSGTINPVESKRINLLITNDSKNDVKLNFGINTEKNNGSCTLNIKEPKNTISLGIDEYKELTKSVNENEKPIHSQEGYHIYKDISEKIAIKEDIYVGKKFTYQNEMFTLVNPILANFETLEKNNNDSYYACFDKENCKFLYNIKEVTHEVVKSETNQEKKEYSLSKYDILKGYQETDSGIKKITKNDIIDNYYYGDNPNNYVYFNCKDNNDLKSCELWRIVGTIYEPSVKKYVTKIIRDSSIGLYNYSDKSNIWGDSLLNKELNENYAIMNKEYLYEYTTNQDYLETISSDINTIKEFSSSKEYLSIIKLSDYLYASSCNNTKIDEYDEKCLKNNWMNNNDGVYYTLTSKKEPTKNTELNKDELLNKKTPVEDTTIVENKVYAVGDTIDVYSVDTKLKVRPVAYLKPRMLVVSGNGTFEEPYVIK